MEMPRDADGTTLNPLQKRFGKHEATVPKSVANIPASLIIGRSWLLSMRGMEADLR